MLTLLALATLAWAVLASLCLLVGSRGTGWPNRWQLDIRLPQVLIASLIGAALAAAGVVYQAILRNPLADPYLLGVSSGASLASYIWRLPVVASVAGAVGLTHSTLSQQAFSFAGALISIAVVFLLSTRRGRLEPLTLLLVGVIVNIVNAAIFLLISEIVRDQTQQATFIVGGIQTPTTQQAIIVALGVALAWLILLAISGSLNVAMLSEGEAQALGVRIYRLRWIALLVASLMTASVVAISGPIGFVGLICPHLSRLVVGNDQRRLLIVATAAGAVLLAIADATSRLLAQPQLAGTLLPVGILTSLMGGPFFLLLLWQTRRRALLAEAGQ
jgi:iron complex transport system permease protein